MDKLLRRAGPSRAALPGQSSRPSASSSRTVFSAITKPFQEFQEAQMRPRQPSKREEAASRRNAIAAGQGNKFDQLLDIIKKQYPQTLPYLGPRAKPREKATEHHYSTAKFKHSHRKLNDLGRLIARLPVDQAILQMQVCDKKASDRILSTLALARDHALQKGLSREKLIVDEAWVDKGPTLKRPDIKARGKMGIKEHRTARLHVVLREGPTAEEQQLKAAEKKRKHMLRAALMHGQFDAQVNRPVYNRGLTRGVGFV